jgi:murein L,D-transpeptidase YafK
VSVLIFIFLTFIVNSSFAFKAEVCLPKKNKIIIASMEDGLLRLIEKDNKGKEKTETFYASFGEKKGGKSKEGDNKTPIGVYFANSIVTRGEVPDEIYGAVTIPLNYPNPIDKKAKKTGNGIWIHGTDDVERLSNKSASRGCIILENKEILKLHKMIRINKTPIIITKKFKDIKFVSNDCTNPEVVVNDNGLRYKVTSSGLASSNVLYQFLE